MADRSHLSIGEVLSLLQDEFPDVTISKIRFLESQGLLDPERTPSGYRKFYEDDIERLRWILTQQRENFLPLKVIKDRLDEAQRAGAVVPADVEPAPPADPSPPAVEVAPSTPAPSLSPKPAASHAPGLPAGGVRPAPEPVRPTIPDPSPSPAPRLDPGPTGVSLMLEELAKAAGLLREDVDDLVQYGLIQGRTVGADVFYDGDALVVARTAAAFLQHGIEARHLRTYKIAADREAGFYEQVVMPLLKQRNPESRQQAADTLGELARLGEQLRAALLRVALREHTS